MSRFTAMNTLQACLADRELMADALKYFLVKYPGQAEACIAKVEPGTITVNVPFRDDSVRRWNAQTYQLKLKDAKEFSRIYRSGQVVMAIKECRAVLNLGLKDAKDLVEYLADSNKY